MSSYVAVSLLKKYRRPTKHPQFKVKWELFIHVLTGMKAVNQPGEPESVLDYTKLWSELIDRGGLSMRSLVNVYVTASTCMCLYV